MARNPLGSARPSSARALLLVMIGEFVWPAGQPAWSSTLLSGLAEFGIEPSAARKALQRIAATGITASGRKGNRVRWSVTAKGDRILRAGWERTYGWHARPTAWDGRWLVLSVTVPESQRKLRHHLQNRLLWAGLGSPAPGEWLTPHAERGEQVGAAMSCTSPQNANGVGNINLEGTPFQVDSTFAVGGFQATGSATVSPDHQVAALKGGGYCGWITPAPALYNPFNPSPGEYHLQLSCAQGSFSLRLRQFCIHIG